jgi:c-di-GMP-binding flagellar brake protein YcgR
MGMQQDKRTHRRKALRADATIADVLGNTWSRIELLDISQNGLAFLAADEYAAGSSRMVRFHLPGHECQLAVLCRIVHCTPHSYLGGHRIGTAFVRMEVGDAQAVGRFIET